MEKHPVVDAGAESAVDQGQDFPVCDIVGCGHPFTDLSTGSSCGPVTGSCAGDGLADRTCADFTDADTSAVAAACAARGGDWATNPCDRSAGTFVECIAGDSSGCVYSWFGVGTDPMQYCTDNGGTLIVP